MITSDYFASPFLLVLLFFLSACGPTIYYLGDSYPAKERLEVFYDDYDVKRQYEVIGRMTHDQWINYDPQIIKEEMLKEAKKRGADAIVFSDFGSSATDDNSTILIKSKLIRYKD